MTCTVGMTAMGALQSFHIARSNDRLWREADIGSDRF